MRIAVAVLGLLIFQVAPPVGVFILATLVADMAFPS